MLILPLISYISLGIVLMLYFTELFNDKHNINYQSNRDEFLTSFHIQSYV